MPPEHYRYYRVDDLGHLHDAEWLSAATDEEAVAQARTDHAGVICEVWQGTRLVAKLSPVRLSS